MSIVPSSENEPKNKITPRRKKTPMEQYHDYNQTAVEAERKLRSFDAEKPVAIGTKAMLLRSLDNALPNKILFVSAARSLPEIPKKRTAALCKSGMSIQEGVDWVKRIASSVPAGEQIDVIFDELRLFTPDVDLFSPAPLEVLTKDTRAVAALGDLETIGTVLIIGAIREPTL